MSLPKCSKKQNTRQRMTGENDSLVYIDQTFLKPLKSLLNDIYLRIELHEN